MMKRVTAVCMIIGMVAMAALCGAARAEGLPNLFYAMDTGTDSKNLSADAQAQMVKELGFSGIDIVYGNLDKVKATMMAVDKAGIKLVSVYFPMFVEKGQPTDTANLKEFCETLKGRDTIVMIPLNSKSYKPSSTEGDAQALELLRQASAIAEANGLRIAIYPHFNSWVERVDHASRLVKGADRKNVGVVFNLCHFLKTDGTNVEERIKDAMPVLFAVTICGADKSGREAKGWSRLIMPLNQGDYDVAGFLAEFVKLGYKGPIGLQHYGIQGDARENLNHSMAGWRKVSAEAARLAAK